MNPTEDVITELENRIKQRTNKIQDLRDQQNSLNKKITKLALKNHTDKVKLKKLKKEAEYDKGS